MWVVKLGGSLALNPVLKDWLDLLARDGGGRAVVVPGGGPCADTVRMLDHHWTLPDPVAHRMALLAMEQYGLMFAGLQPRLRLARTAGEIKAVLAQGAAAVWLPAEMATGPEGQDIEQNWNMTSDSLAAWLAARLTAHHLVLVKAAEPPAVPVSAGELAEQGIVDPRFSNYARKGGFAVWWLGASQPDALERALLGGAGPGSPVALD